MAKRGAAAAEKVTTDDRSSVPRLVGKEVVFRPLQAVTKNNWNPNAMDAFERESLKQGLLADGWLISQALLIWGSDERGKTKNIIIDGEHRWTVASELGFKEGPMVFLHKLTEAAAKALTIKMNAKRGRPVEEKLALLVRELQSTYQGPNLGLELGLHDEHLMKLLAEPPMTIPGGLDADPAHQPPGNIPSGMTSHVRMVQLFFDEAGHEEFTAAVKTLGPRYGKDNTSDVILEAVRRAAATKG